MIRLFVVILISYLPVIAQTIKGRVMVSGTEDGIAYASIYFDGILKGTSSDESGNFELPPTNSGQPPIIISAIGYFSTTLTEYSPEKTYKVFLNPKTYSLETVAITGPGGMSREEKEKRFKKAFLGTTANGLKCIIKNMDAVNLVYNKRSKTLEAFSDEPIFVYNPNLGYSITYYLDKFMMDDKVLSYQGFYFFEEDSSANSENVKKLNRRRKQAYLGSRMHFIRSIWNNNLATEDFKVFDNTHEQVVIDNLLLVNGSSKQLKMSDRLRVIYKNDLKNSSYMLKKQDLLTIDENGFYDPFGVDWSGSMGNQRVGDLLPFEYQPPKR